MVRYSIALTFPNDYYENGITITFSVSSSGSNCTTARLNVTPKGLGRITNRTFPTSVACDFRGNKSYIVEPVQNADTYTWSNTAGWTITSYGNSADINFTNGQPGTVKVIASNSACAASAKDYALPVTRPTPVIYPSFVGNIAVCEGVPTTATVAASANGIRGYEWYSIPANQVYINGASYSSPNAPLFTSTNSVTLTKGIGNGHVDLFARIAFEGCGSGPYQWKGIGTGIPQITGWSTSQQTNIPGWAQSTCPGTYITLHPILNVPGDIALEHQWEHWGDINLMSTTNGPALSVISGSTTSSYGYAKYRVRTACGWSNWQEFSITTRDCAGGEDPERATTIMAKKSDSQQQKGSDLKFTISPNPTKGLVNIKMEKGLAAGKVLVSVTDMNQKVVYNSVFSAGIFNIQLDNLRAGVYFIKLQQGNKVQIEKLVIVK